MRATDKQKEYAQDIADALGCDLPLKDDKQAYSEFIGMYVGEYKELMREMALDYELEMECIDARRDW